MKSKLFLLLLLAFCASFPFQSHGQAALLVLIFGDDVATDKFHFSLDGGLNITEIQNLNGKSAVYVNFGLGAHLKLSDRWSFAPEFKPLSGRGERKIERFTEIPPELGEEIESIETRVKLNYLDVPLLFRYKASKHFYLAAGPQVSFRTSAKVLTDVFLDDGREIVVTDPIEDITQWYEFSFPIEVGYNFMQQNHLGGVDLRVRFVPGFTEIINIDGSSLKNNNIQIIASFPFLLNEEKKAEKELKKEMRRESRDN